MIRIKELSFFIYPTFFLLLYCCFVSSEDIAYTYEDPIKELQLLKSIGGIDGTMMIWMVAEDPEREGCILPEFHLRLIDKIGQITYIDLNYTFPEVPKQAYCPDVQLDFIPLTQNYIMITYPKLLNNNDVEKYGLIINYSGKIIR